MHIEILIFFFLIAAVYASAGFGGGSSYLALLALYAVPMATMRPTALICNIVVVIGGSFLFWKNGFLNFRKILPLSIASVPMAFVGGLLPLKERTFFILLGFSLLAAALLMLFQKKQTESNQTVGVKSKNPIIQQSVIGGSIGFLSGMVGIGGGIFLSPILHLLRFDTPKNIAATASFFILINSISGLIGQLSKNPTLDWAFIAPLTLAVLLGGQVGSRLTTFRLNQTLVRKVTAVLVFYAGINILSQNL